jgi:coniferyl-aldehyde dehydrogenase
VSDPGTGPEVLELSRLYERQREAFLKDMAPSHATRTDRLDRFAAAVERHASRFVEVISEDFGHRSAFETQGADIGAILSMIRHTRRHLVRWMKPRRVPTAPAFWPGSSRIVRQPLGVVGIISPWNYPLYLSAGPLVAVLAAGNRALVKPSELTPRFGELLKKAVSELFPEEEIAVVTGGPDVAQALTRLPLDHLVFTGSTAVGRLVARAAAENLTPVTLELGGKSPAIVDQSADFDAAVPRITWAKLFSAGQTCMAPDYALVPAARLEEFAEAVKRTAAKFYPTLDGNPSYTSVVNDRHFARLTGLVEDARVKGARVVEVRPDGWRPDPAARKLPPTLVLGADAGMRIMQEEIFGPLLPIVPYASVEEALRFVNERDRPLALYWFGRDSASRDRVLAGTISGGVTVNDCMLHVIQQNLPFGGVGPSGMGAYHGEHGFRRFSHEKAVFRVRGRFGGSFLFHPPLGRAAELARKVLARLG